MTILAIVHVIFLVVLCIVNLGLAISVAVRPSQRRFDMLRPLCWATVFASLSSIFSGLCNTFMRLAERPAGAELMQTVWAGLAEALVLGILGFGVLAVSSVLSAVGLRRQD